ncbi:hypothetical protein NHX12_027626 [Muraenolepis orangiensis]|uniref:Uncharacterized protein n=1 Tax=Muraenolepis orangiensis TaxID=630683 RepID=A0A9Q0EGY4_9TELE|nr:hypothetical protein NHX12_027626 [Muraenolepis orangiensis]
MGQILKVLAPGRGLEKKKIRALACPSYACMGSPPHLPTLYSTSNDFIFFFLFSKGFGRDLPRPGPGTVPVTR